MLDFQDFGMERFDIFWRYEQKLERSSDALIFLSCVKSHGLDNPFSFVLKKINA